MSNRPDIICHMAASIDGRCRIHGNPQLIEFGYVTSNGLEFRNPVATGHRVWMVVNYRVSEIGAD